MYTYFILNFIILVPVRDIEFIVDRKKMIACWKHKIIIQFPWHHLINMIYLQIYRHYASRTSVTVNIILLDLFNYYILISISIYYSSKCHNTSHNT